MEWPTNEDGRLSVADARRALRHKLTVACTIYSQGARDVVVPKRVLREMLDGLADDADSGMSAIDQGDGLIVVRLELLGDY